MKELIIDEFPVAEGNWILKIDGIHHKYNKHWFIPKIEIALKEGKRVDAPWMWPMHFNRKNIINLDDISDLIKFTAILRNRMGYAEDHKRDEITWNKVLKEKEINDLDFLDSK